LNLTELPTDFAERAAYRLHGVRALRAVADGLVATTLAAALASRGISPRGVGVLITATLFGSAVLVTLIGLRADLVPPERAVRWVALAMAATGVAFALIDWYWLLLVVAIAGPLNPSGGDVSPFLPAEQAMLTAGTPTAQRTKVFARHNIAGNAGAMVGGLLTGAVVAIGTSQHWSRRNALSLVFWIYAAVGLASYIAYLRMQRHASSEPRPAGRLVESRKVVRELTLLFCLDAAGGGFAVNALLAVWLSHRHNFSLANIGFIFGAASLLSAVSALTAPRLVRKWGLVDTMVITHIPASLFLAAAVLAPSGGIAVAFLLVRALCSQLDVPPRQAFVMELVTPSERAAAASYTNVPRSLAAATTPALAGFMLERSNFGWPFLACAVLKIIYDILLWLRFSTRRPATHQ
jgi:MFS family permease